MWKPRELESRQSIEKFCSLRETEVAKRVSSEHRRAWI